MADDFTQQYVTLTLQYDIGDSQAQLTLQGPKIGDTDLAPTIGLARDGKGKYSLLIGSGEYTFKAEELPKELVRLAGGGGGSPLPFRMPRKDQLRRRDGSYKTFQDYERERKLWHSPLPGNTSVWPRLPAPLYDALIDFYLGRHLRNYGDFPMPSDDYGVG
jgi:hypothetical protein